MRLVCGVEHRLAAGRDGRCLAEVDHGRSEQTDAGMAMLLVVPVEELLAEGAAILDATEAIRKLRAVLQRPELALRIRVVVGNKRAGDYSFAIQVERSSGQGQTLARVTMD